MLLNIVNSVLNGTFETNNGNYNVFEYSLDLCKLLLTQQFSYANNSDLPKYVKKLPNKYYHNLDHIMIFWNHMYNNDRIKYILYENVDVLFLNLNIVFNLFSNMQQIKFQCITLKERR